MKQHLPPPSGQMNYDIIWFLAILKNILKLCTNSIPTSVIVVSIINTSLFVIKKIIGWLRRGKEREEQGNILTLSLLAIGD